MVCERAQKAMAEALFVKSEEAGAGDAHMLPLFGVRIDFVSIRSPLSMQMMNSRAGDGEEAGDIPDFDEAGTGLKESACEHL